MTDPALASAGGSAVDPLLERCILAQEEGRPLEVERLLAQQPERAAEVRAQLQQLQQLGLLQPPAPARIPERLGEYRLLRPLGKGGMGVVYLAEQESLHREVALKLVRPEMLYFPGTRERFRREVLAVARLEHPGIVPVHTFGEIDGVPFYAMQRLCGTSLGELLHELAGSDPARLDGRMLAAAFQRALAHKGETVEPPTAPLFAAPWPRVCCQLVRDMALALQHAHQHGVLHRDVKPSNAMLTADGSVRLIDFGLASTQGQARITRAGASIGSLPYMAPEQVRGDLDAIDARTDVYGLGVTLYELLTLSLPHGDGSGSTRERILGGSVEPPTLRNARVHADAEAICLQAIEVEPQRRYADAAALAADLQRFLDLEPVLARRQTAALRLRRWLRRHPSPATALLLAFLLLVLGPLLFGVQQSLAAERIDAALQLARQQEQRAVANLERALAAVDTMLRRTAQARLQDVPRTKALQRQLLEDALAFHEALVATEAGPRTREERARSLRAVGQLRLQLGDAAGAEAAQRQAIAGLQQLLAAPAAPPRLQRELAHACNGLADALRRLGRRDEHRQAVAAACEHWQRAVALQPDDLRLRLARADSRVEAALVAADDGEPAAALVQLRAIDAELAPAPDLQGELLEDWLLDWARIADARGMVLTQSGETLAAQRAFAAAMRRYRQSVAVAADGLGRRGRIELAALQERLALVAQQRREWETAKPLLEAAVAAFEQLAADEPEVPDWQVRLAMLLSTRADNRARLGDQAAVLADHDRAVAVLEQLVGRFDEAVHRQKLASACGRRAIARLMRGNRDGAVADFARSTAEFEALLAADPADGNALANLVAALQNQSMGEARLGQLAAARRSVARALELRAGSGFGEAERSHIELLLHASELAMHDRDGEAGEAFMLEADRRAAAWLQQNPDDPVRQGLSAQVAVNRGTLQLMHYRLDEAAATFTAAVPLARAAAKVGTANRQTLAALLLRLCDVQLRRQEPDAARQWFAAAIAEAGARKEWFRGNAQLTALFERPEYAALLPAAGK